MKRFYIKLLILFVLMLAANSSLCFAQGIDVADLKKVKNIKTIFKKNPKKEKTEPKGMNFKEVYFTCFRY